MWQLFCNSRCMRDRLGLCYDGKEEVCVCWREITRDRKREKDGRIERVRMRPMTVMCLHSSDTTMWHSSAGLLHVLREGKREREWEKERSVNNAHWVLWGSSWWDVQWPKGDLFRPARGASHYPAAFICLEVDGWSVFILVKYCNRGPSSCKWKGNSTHLTKLTEASLGEQLKIKGDGDHVNVWWGR